MYECKCIWVHLFLTRAKLPFGADAAEIITFAVFAPHFSKVSWVTATLAAHAVPSSTANSCIWGRFTAVYVGGLVVIISALTLWPQASWVTQTHSALQCAIAVMTGGASRLRRVLAWTVACKINCYLERIFKSKRLYDEWLTFHFRTATELCLYIEWHLN